MTPPPPFAMWLLRRWTFASRQESLIGDLLEQYGQGRSRLWFWWQTAEAVLFSAASNGVLVARAIAASLVLISALEWIPLWLYEQSSLWVWNWSVH